MNQISVFSREDFCKLNFTASESDSRTQLIDNLISYWTQPILKYIEHENRPKPAPGESYEKNDLRKVISATSYAKVAPQTFCPSCRKKGSLGTSQKKPQKWANDPWGTCL